MSGSTKLGSMTTTKLKPKPMYGWVDQCIPSSKPTSSNDGMAGSLCGGRVGISCTPELGQMARSCNGRFSMGDLCYKYRGMPHTRIRRRFHRQQRANASNSENGNYRRILRRIQHFLDI